MKRLPLLVSFLLFIALCASIAYWITQLFKPPLRPVAAPPRVASAPVNIDQAASLLGGRGGKVAVASNYQLMGVIFSGSPRDSVAILSSDGQPAQAIRAQTELAPGVIVKEVHRDYVLLSESGVMKRVELPEDAKDANSIATTSPVQNRATSRSGAPSRYVPTPLPGRAAAPTPPPSMVPMQRGAAAQAPPVQQAVPSVPPSAVVSPPQQPVPPSQQAQPLQPGQVIPQTQQGSTSAPPTSGFQAANPSGAAIPGSVAPGYTGPVPGR